MYFYAGVSFQPCGMFLSCLVLPILFPKQYILGNVSEVKGHIEIITTLAAISSSLILMPRFYFSFLLRWWILTSAKTTLIKLWRHQWYAEFIDRHSISHPKLIPKRDIVNVCG